MKVNSLAAASEQGVSHNPRIRKRVLIADAQIGHVSNFAQAVFPPGEIACAHRHEDMTEVFFVESGEGRMVVDDEPVAITAGVCVTVDRGEVHEIQNTGSDDLVITYFGIRTPPPE